MGYHQIPAVPNHVEYIALIVIAWHISRQQIAAHRIMTVANKRIPNYSAEFTCDQNFQRSPRSAFSIRSALLVSKAVISNAWMASIVSRMYFMRPRPDCPIRRARGACAIRTVGERRQVPTPH